MATRWRGVIGLAVAMMIAGCDAVGLNEPTPEVTILPYGANETLAVGQIIAPTIDPARADPTHTATPQGNAITTPTQAPSITPRPSLTSTPGPAFVPQNTSAPLATATATLTLPDCTPRADWPVYTVQRGDTLGTIASRFGSDAASIAEASCLANVNLIEVGQALRVPPSTQTANLDRPASLIFYAIATDNREGITVGCGDTAVAVIAGIPPSGDLLTDLALSLQYLIDYRTATAAPGLSTALSIAGASVETLAVNDGLAVIAIDAPLTLAGVCADARLEAQVLLTVFQYEEIERARITFGGQNLKQLLDASGETGDDAVYTREDLPSLE